MNEDEALAALTGTSTHERRAAARYFEGQGLVRHEQMLREALASESDTWTRRSLERAIARIALLETDVDVAPAADVPDEIREIRARVTEEVGRELVHELEPTLGLLRVSAMEEIPGFENSETKGHLKQLSLILEGIDQLSKASAVAVQDEFDIAASIVELVTEVQGRTDVRIDLGGPPALVVVGDDSLVALAVRNGLANAVEASEQVGKPTPPPVVVTWNRTPAEYQVSIVDQGPGLPSRRSALGTFGTSTKSGHRGMGLAIAQAAALSLGGQVSLRNRPDGGVRFELRWPRGEGNANPPS